MRRSFYNQNSKKKEGMSKPKLTTLIVQDANDLKGQMIDFDGSIDLIGFVPQGVESMNDLASQMKDLTLYVIAPKPDPNLTALGIDLPYYAVDPIRIEDMNLIDDPDNLLLNGDSVKIPWKDTGEQVPIIGTYFMDEEYANSYCQEFQIYTNMRVDKIMAVLAKSKKMREDVSAKSMS